MGPKEGRNQVNRLGSIQLPRQMKLLDFCVVVLSLIHIYKVNALVYYILVKGTVVRDELSGILWGDKSDAIARKNLRNAIYETKKLLGPNVFVSPRKAIIKVNPCLLYTS